MSDPIEQIDAVQNITQVERLLPCNEVARWVSQAFELGKTVYYASHNGVPIGLSTIGFNDFHPYWARPFVYVDQAYRRQGVGSALYHHLLQETLPSNVLGFQCGADVQNNALKAFTEVLGFKRVLDCYCVVFDCVQVPYPDYSLLADNGLYLCDLAQAEALSLDTRAFLIEAYNRDHDWSRPVPNESPLWAQALLKFDPHFSFVIHDGKAIKACITSCAVSNSLNIWWLYSARGSDYLLTFLLSHLATFAMSKQITLADMEIDSNRTNFNRLCQFIPFNKKEIWRVYQYAF